MASIETRGLTIAAARRLLEEGNTGAEALLRACNGRIDDPAGEGAAAFIEVFRSSALVEARTADARRAAGLPARPLEGVPLSVKDLFDVGGSVTRAGSRVLAETAPATRDAVLVSRLRAAGAVIIGRTNLSEFAFTGLGLNPHYGTPRAPWRRARGHAPGGSSSGSAVSVADGMAVATVGTDTGGSGRIPAAFCGITGFKPTRGRVPLDGTFPLSASFDTASPMANSVEDCRLLFEVMSGVACGEPVAPRPIRLGLVPWRALGDHDAPVAAAFDAALARLQEDGTHLETVEDFDWSLPGRILQDGRITAVEGLAAHGALFARRVDYDPRVAARLASALEHPAVAYADAVTRMRAVRGATSSTFARYDALVMPTTPILPPALDTLTGDDGFTSSNLAALRHTLIVNVLDGCAVSLPLSGPEGEPVGLMLFAGPGRDEALLSLAKAVEASVTNPVG